MANPTGLLSRPRAPQAMLLLSIDDLANREAFGSSRLVHEYNGERYEERGNRDSSVGGCRNRRSPHYARSLVGGLDGDEREGLGANSTARSFLAPHRGRFRRAAAPAQRRFDRMP